MIKKILKILILLFIQTEIFGQVPPVSDHYILNPLTINPAFAGARGTINAAAFYRRQWVGITGAPETLTLSADSPLKDENTGLGFMLMTDKIGVTRENSISGKYSYKIKTGEGYLSFGLGAGILTTNTAWSDLVVLDPGDEFYLIDSKVFVVPDFSFGMYYNSESYYAGLSIPRLLGYKFNFDKNRYSLNINPGQYYYLLTGGTSVELTPLMRFLPSALVSYSPGEKVILDLNAHFNYQEILWFGTSYRTNNSMSVLLQYSLNSQFKIAYSYFIDFSRIGRYSNGSHEIMLRYEFRHKIDVVNPLIF